MKERILITVKTYPTISRRYSELVCTAGIREDGSWMRIYPVAFRQWDSQYNKYQWVEVDVVKNKQDRRVESYRPLSPDSITLLDKIGTANDWYERRDYVLGKGNVYRDLQKIIDLNKEGRLSLATFKPAQVIDLVVEPTAREWDRDKIESLHEKSRQGDLFGDAPEYFRVVKKLPYKFSYKIVDAKDKESTMMIEDWEIGQLFWNCVKKYGDEQVAIQHVREKYLNYFVKSKDLHLFLGTTLKYDGWAMNPFVVIGVFYPPKIYQQVLF